MNRLLFSFCSDFRKDLLHIPDNEEWQIVCVRVLNREPFHICCLFQAVSDEQLPIRLLIQLLRVFRQKAGIYLALRYGIHLSDREFSRFFFFDMQKRLQEAYFLQFVHIIFQKFRIICHHRTIVVVIAPFFLYVISKTRSKDSIYFFVN